VSPHVQGNTGSAENAKSSSFVVVHRSQLQMNENIVVFVVAVMFHFLYAFPNTQQTEYVTYTKTLMGCQLNPPQKNNGKIMEKEKKKK